MERLTRRDWSKYGFYDKETPILGARREYELYQRLGRYEDIGTLEECRAAVEEIDSEKMEDLYKVKKGDKVLAECTVETVFVQSGMVMVTTRDCDNGFDAYIGEIKEK